MKIIKSLLLIMVAGAIIIGTTAAYFSNTATSTDNTFAAGNLDLKLSDADETVQDTVASSWAGSDMAPGGSAVSGTVLLRNTGAVIGDHSEVQSVNTCSQADMDKYLEITAMSYDGGSILGSLADSNTNGYKDLNDLTAADALDNLALADLNINHPFIMSVRLNSTTPDTYQSKSCTSVFTFTLNQHSSQ